MKSRIARAYDAVAEFYDEYMGETGHIQAQRKIARQIRRMIDGTVLDVATGTGIIARYLGAIGLDASSGMIRRARVRSGDGQFIVADAEYLPFRDGSFDAVTSCLAFLWFPDQKGALKEMLRVGKKVFIIEEEGTPARRRINIPEHLRPFFKEIEELETPVSIKELDGVGRRVGEADIDGSHKFVAWVIG